jgi:hypothetical protein
VIFVAGVAVAVPPPLAGGASCCCGTISYTWSGLLHHSWTLASPLSSRYSRGEAIQLARQQRDHATVGLERRRVQVVEQLLAGDHRPTQECREFSDEERMDLAIERVTDTSEGIVRRQQLFTQTAISGGISRDG